jgi:hypothetical protein
VITGVNTGNFLIQYQIDTGSGFGALKTLNATNLSGETISPTTGFKLKYRISVTVANATNSLTYITITGTTNLATQQAAQYPLPVILNYGNITNLVAGSRIQIYNVNTSTQIVNEIVPTTSYQISYVEGNNFSANDVIRVRITNNNVLVDYEKLEVLTVASSTG